MFSIKKTFYIAFIALLFGGGLVMYPNISLAYTISSDYISGDTISLSTDSNSIHILIYNDYIANYISNGFSSAQSLPIGDTGQGNNGAAPFSDNFSFSLLSPNSKYVAIGAYQAGSGGGYVLSFSANSGLTFWTTDTGFSLTDPTATPTPTPTPAGIPITASTDSFNNALGFSFGNVASWANARLLLILGSGLGILTLLFPYVLALVAISSIVYFVYRAFINPTYRE